MHFHMTDPDPDTLFGKIADLALDPLSDQLFTAMITTLTSSTFNSTATAYHQPTNLTVT
jgi:hypothetical protein